MEKSLDLSVDRLDDLPDAAEKFYDFIRNQPVKFIAFYGEMGAGKTTFITSLIKKMGVAEHGSSPTFALINQYVTDQNEKIYHCDFYRLKSAGEALDLGIEEMLQEDAWIFAEWPEKLGNLLPDKIVSVKITDQNGSRKIEAKV